MLYPLLLSLGLAPITANASTSISVWPGAISSAYGYRKHLRKIPRYFLYLLIPCVIGGLIGAVILKHTSNNFFEVIVPWFIVFGVVLLAFQRRLHKLLYQKTNKKTAKKHSKITLYAVGLTLFIVSIYGGFFGAGFGIIMLALLGLTELKDIQQMNGLKNLGGAGINIFASIYFIANRLIDWKIVPVTVVGSVVGGYLGSTYSAKLPGNTVRKIVIAIGLLIAIVLFIKN